MPWVLGPTGSYDWVGRYDCIATLYPVQWYDCVETSNPATWDGWVGTPNSDERYGWCGSTGAEGPAEENDRFEARPFFVSPLPFFSLLVPLSGPVFGLVPFFVLVFDLFSPTAVELRALDSRSATTRQP